MRAYAGPTPNAGWVALWFFRGGGGGGWSYGQLRKNNLRKVAIIFLSICLNSCFECSKEPSHRDGSFEYPQHMFWLRNKKNKFQLLFIIWGLCLYQFSSR